MKTAVADAEANAGEVRQKTNLSLLFSRPFADSRSPCSFPSGGGRGGGGRGGMRGGSFGQFGRPLVGGARS